MAPAPDPLEPSAAALAWVARAAGARAQVRGMRRLRGGGWHVNHIVEVRLATGARRRFVLRRWARPGWAIDDPDMTPEREAAVLALLERARAPVPRVVAVDPDGAAVGVPALLETVLPGRRVVRPRDREVFADRLAEPLAWIHAIDVERSARDLIRYRRYYDPARLTPPEWSVRQATWERALELAGRPVPMSAAGFIHRDYYHGNVLWTLGRISGVVDWTSASFGPFAVDIGHARWNLVASFERTTADRFLAAARALGVGAGYTPEWDVRTTLDVLPELRPGHDSLVALRRTEDHVARALAELG